MVWVGYHQLFYFMKVFRGGFEALFPPIDTEDPVMYAKLEKFMKSRF